MNSIYKDMLGIMQSRRGPYSGLDIPEFYAVVEELFTPEEAAVNNILIKKPETLRMISERCGRPMEELYPVIESMANKGLVVTFMENGERVYYGLPFMPGIFEYTFISGDESEHSRKLARLIKDYKVAYVKNKGLEKVVFPLTRVIPVNRTIDAGNRIHTYDQVATYIQKYDSIAVGSCYCRHAAKLRGEDIHGVPTEVCLWFGTSADYMMERVGGRKLSKDEAMTILDDCEEAGLVHMSRNTSEDIEFLCNCDRWHCEVVTNILKQPKPGWAFNSGFEPKFNADKCVACGTCLDRCPSGALSLGDDVPVVNMDRCFGCAVCATGCSEKAITMAAKTGYPEPPRDMNELISSLKEAYKKQAS